MDEPNLFVSTCSRRELAKRRSVARRGRNLRRRERSAIARLAGFLATSGLELTVASVLVAGAVAYVVGRGGL